MRGFFLTQKRLVSELPYRVLTLHYFASPTLLSAGASEKFAWAFCCSNFLASQGAPTPSCPVKNPNTMVPTNAVARLTRIPNAYSVLFLVVPISLKRNTKPLARLIIRPISSRTMMVLSSIKASWQDSVLSMNAINASNTFCDSKWLADEHTRCVTRWPVGTSTYYKGGFWTQISGLGFGEWFKIAAHCYSSYS